MNYRVRLTHSPLVRYLYFGESKPRAIAAWVQLEDTMRLAEGTGTIEFLRNMEPLCRIQWRRGEVTSREGELPCE